MVDALLFEEWRKVTADCSPGDFGESWLNLHKGLCHYADGGALLRKGFDQNDMVIEVIVIQLSSFEQKRHDLIFRVSFFLWCSHRFSFIYPTAWKRNFSYFQDCSTGLSKFVSTSHLVCSIYMKYHVLLCKPISIHFNP